MLTIENLTKAFKEIDKNGNGMIEKEEIKRAFEAGGVYQRTDSFWEDFMGRIDSNHNKQISLEEFINHM